VASNVKMHKNSILVDRSKSLFTFFLPVFFEKFSDKLKLFYCHCCFVVYINKREK
jgi:hypothetical protein